jgi:4-hydroxybenzoate polyprenyltransferase
MISPALRYLRSCFSFVRFGHSVFALPFALVGALLAAEQHPPTLARIGWIVVAMVTARTAAMGFNRLVDARFDARNPRTAGRELPRGVLSRGDAIGLVALSSIAFVLVTTQLGWICLLLSPLALAIVFWYSLAKRFTTWTQLFLGLALAVAPVGGWLAAGGRGGWEPWLLALAIGTWVAGFDILYACQDLAFDRAHGLRSIPVRFGVARSLAIARGLHVATVAAMAAVALAAPLGPAYLAGVGGVALLLVWEQSLVRADDLSRVKQAFDLNGYVGLFYLAATAGALYVR